MSAKVRLKVIQVGQESSTKAAKITHLYSTETPHTEWSVVNNTTSVNKTCCTQNGEQIFVFLAMMSPVTSLLVPQGSTSLYLYSTAYNYIIVVGQ